MDRPASIPLETRHLGRLFGKFGEERAHVKIAVHERERRVRSGIYEERRDEEDLMQSVGQQHDI